MNPQTERSALCVSANCWDSIEAARESSYNEYLMGKLDEQYTQTPFYGVLGMTEVLREPKEKRSILNESVVYPG